MEISVARSREPAGLPLDPNDEYFTILRRMEIPIPLPLPFFRAGRISITTSVYKRPLVTPSVERKNRITLVVPYLMTSGSESEKRLKLFFPTSVVLRLNSLNSRSLPVCAP